MYDSEESRMLGELQELKDEIAAVETVIGIMESLDRPSVSSYQKHIKKLDRILYRLNQEEDRLESRLRIHRQKVTKSGVKY